MNVSVVNNAMIAARMIPSQVKAQKGNFMDNLKEMFLSPDRILQQMADPEVTNITLGSLGTFDKNSPSFQLATSVYISRTEAALQSVLSTLKFENDTASAIGRLFG